MSSAISYGPRVKGLADLVVCRWVTVADAYYWEV